ncbi:hypothetical protein FNF31_04227 [Cafeteria roenbergensis]|uniref:FCP1 homology domain-containing protein n=1 Tax=Cafeteria roenbergensis TaxID=33653 RepID=A0A5A8E2X4_CAFRO|nr:hypothetical protein FNF31_04227 [Cafeteria roenbergensis]KAA0172132.1 hypothetical protein FNF28_00135 [Cafeteria roenbergensis]
MEATSTTPGRSGWGAGRGYYADPKSPIASTPQQRRSGRGYPTTPSMASLSPMKHSEIVRARRVDERGAAGDVPAGRTGGLFSPTARIAEEDAAAVAVTNTDKENRLGGARAAAAIAAEAAAGYPSVSSTASAASAATAATAPAHDSEAHPGEMSTALTAAAAADLASRVSAAHAAIEATDNWEAYEEFNPYLFIRLLPPYSSVRPRVNRVVLPRKVSDAPPISLVLDLDETLVHCSVEPIPDPDLRFPVVFGGHTYQVYVRKRPFLERFLARVASKFEVTVFTASQSVYASRLLDLIDPHHRWIRHRLYREACLNVDGNYIKDLNVLGRDLKQTVLVDNSQHAFGYHLDNGVPIESWFEDPDDRELLKLAWFLERELHGCEDVRPIVRRKFRMRSLVEHR